MNDLDRQLAELAMINKAELQPSSLSNTPGKKIGPAVPRSQKRHNHKYRNRTPLKQTVEPSYASRLQANQFYSNVPPPNMQSHYSNSPTLASGTKFQHSQDNNYVNLPRENDRTSQYSNLPRSASSASSSSVPPPSMNYFKVRIFHRRAPSPKTSLSRQNLSSPATRLSSSVTPVTNLVPKGYTKPDHVTYSNIQVGQSRNQDGLIYSNLVHPPREGSSVYSNMPPNSNAYANGDYAPCTVNTNLPPPPEDLLPPPSPVSSSYSELRRATQPGQDFHNYSMGSQFGESDSLYGYGGMSQGWIIYPTIKKIKLTLAVAFALNPALSRLTLALRPIKKSLKLSYVVYRNIVCSPPSTYESIYEPINPRPPSQMSSRSNYSLYAPYVSGTSSTLTGPSQSASRVGHNKEQEVDSLTDLLVQGMGGVGPDADQEDVYGVCVKCGEKIVGENSGCTAMDQLYHTKCFTCHHCAINLQGKPFYALDGNPYCEEDYLKINAYLIESLCCTEHFGKMLRLPKADLGQNPEGHWEALPPRLFLLRRMREKPRRNPLHRGCYESCPLHRRFPQDLRPRCWVCKQPIMPEPGEEETVRVVALDHSFHIQCYKCEDCGLVLSSEAEGRGCYPLDGHVLCKSCNAKRVQALTSHMTTEL
ncbi:hypothetical protein NQ318_005759 [Aromia moschata]|uniref:LIM zinc-binding domain-containing protein n=1 Tax=Aromia moschata TaxID=1265417 RepID=A0AAV8YRI2_9CUCU|nr:hypothetical protein NQ318_005759 [Aromia moschata]